MPQTTPASDLPAAARVFSRLEADDALLSTEASVARKSSAIFLALLMFAAVPVFWAANAAGVIGDVPAAVAKGKGLAQDDDGQLGPGDDEGDDREFLRTNNTSGNNNSTRGTTRDHDTKTNTRGGTNDTSRAGQSTRGTTRDNDTRSNTLNSATGQASNGGGGSITN